MTPTQPTAVKRTRPPVYPTDNGNRYDLTSPTLMPKAGGFLWNQKMMIQLTCRGYATAQFMQPEPAKYAHAPNVEAKTFMQPEQSYYAHHPGRFVYVKDETNGKLFSAPYEPVRAPLDKFVFSAGKSDIKWVVEYNDVRVEMTVGLPMQDVAELWTINLTNLSKESRKLAVTPYFPVGYMSWMNQGAEWRSDLGGVVASCVTPYQKAADYFKTIKHAKDKTYFLCETKPDSWTAGQEAFEGEGGLQNPSALQGAALGGEDARHETPTAAVQYKVSLDANASTTYRFLFGPAFDDAEIINMRDTYLSASAFEKSARVMLLVQAGKAVDDWIESLLPLLERGDIIIDGGNSHFPDSNRRTQYLSRRSIRFVGSGVSGGEEGARYGPSLMPGGNEEAWPFIKDIFQSIAAKSDGEACCEWVGDEGAGHYVKMVHNGIEYGDMQLICEAYDIMKRGLGMENKEMGDVFAKWNKGVLDSFLIEITRDILYFNDDDGTPLVEKILDKAGQKGTGKWTAVNALDLGMPVTLIAESVLARCLSGIKEERVTASTKLEYVGRINNFEGDKDQFLQDLEQALYASKIISYAQGFMLMQEAAKEYQWKLNKPSIALMWRGGCIIRSVFLKDITAAYRKNPNLENLLFDDFFNKAIHKAQPGWRDVVAKAALLGLPTPCFSTALSWFDGYRTKDLPANLLQAQRDYFGAHTFKIKPEAANRKYPQGQDIHVNWTGRGGNVSASTYSA